MKVGDKTEGPLLPLHRALGPHGPLSHFMGTGVGGCPPGRVACRLALPLLSRLHVLYRIADPAVDRPCKCCRLLAGGRGWSWGQQPEGEKPGLPASEEKRPLEPTANLIRRAPGDQEGYPGFPGNSEKKHHSPKLLSARGFSCCLHPSPLPDGSLEQGETAKALPCPALPCLAAHLSPSSGPLWTGTPRMADLSIT